MKPYKISIIMLLLFSFQVAFSQEMRIVSGVMKDNSGEPMPGVNVVVKGTTNGTTTDLNGKYSIKAPLGSTLVFSFIGFNTREVPVTLKNSVPYNSNGNDKNFEPQRKTELVPVQNIGTDREEVEPAEGTAVFTSATPSYAVINPNYNWINDHNIAVDKVFDIDFGSKLARINLVKDEYYRIPHISYYTSISTEQCTKLPKVQNQFAQGRPVNGTSQWFGPETGEMLSWGPNIQNLEYDGSAYDFDKNGRLVPKGTGNGKPAKGFKQPDSAFANGFTYTNNLKIFLKTQQKEYAFMFINKQSRGILPGTKSTGNILDYKWKRIFGVFKLGTQFNLDNLENNYLEGSPANSLVMASILTAPPTFNLTGNQSAKKAYNNKETYQINENLQRSYAMGKVNHPYWLLHNMADKEAHQSFNGQLNMELNLWRQFIWFADFRYQQQESKIISGFESTPYGQNTAGSTSRGEMLNSFLGSTGVKWNRNFENLEINSSLRYDYYDGHSRLNRRDNKLNSDAATIYKYNLSRTEQSLNWNTNLVVLKGLLFKMTHNMSGNNHYRNNKMLYSPTLALGFNFQDLFRFYGFVERAKLKANWGYNYSFVPMSYAYGRYNYQNIASSDFYNTSFDNEIFPDLSIHPEKILKRDIGAEFGFWNNKLSMDLDFYEHKTTNAIFPLTENNELVLKNAATTQVRGIEAEMLFYQRLGYGNNSSQFRLVFDRHKSKVLELTNGLYEIPLGGFSDVHTALKKGMPAGVIVGTAWKRNENGTMVIGSDGYPLVDENLKIIANPEPDFSLGFEATIFLGNFTTTVLMEYHQGGEVWNGTGNVLSYLGLSKKTVDGRKVLEYIFPGVKEDGTVNTTPVDFANPSKPLEQNRWYRYGYTGVAEDAVEDASWFRIREISVSYKFRHQKELNPEFSLFIRNPLLITRYSGVDPNISLWQKANTAGLDLFNMPSVSSIGISAKITL